MTRWIALLMLIAFPASALLPDPPCAVDEATGRIWPSSDPRGTFFVWPASHPGEVVTFDWIDRAGRVHGYVRTCESGAALRWSIDTAGEDAMRPRFHEMLDSDRVYSLGDVGRLIRDYGGHTARAESPGTCACDSVGY